MRSAWHWFGSSRAPAPCDDAVGGHSGEAFLAGFAVRGRELVVYLLADSPAQRALRARLGRHRMGRSCLYFKRLADLDVEILEALIAGSVADVRRRYPSFLKRPRSD